MYDEGESISLVVRVKRSVMPGDEFKNMAVTLTT